MPVITERAPAKVNLYLHILGRRDDGYHLVESAAVFASLCDQVAAAESQELQLSIDGEFAEAAGGGDGNLVLRAARLLQQKTGTTRGASLRLTKNIPVGAGLGGGSADAAATLRALNLLWDLRLPLEALQTFAPELGADVAMCLASQPVIARGIGEILAPLPWNMPVLHAVLVHPCTPLLTADVYADLRTRSLHPQGGTRENSVSGFSETIAALKARRSDLEISAIHVSKAVGEVLAALNGTVPPASLVRMTGSGACCFALYETAEAAACAAENLRAQHAAWFIAATVLS